MLTRQRIAVLAIRHRILYIALVTLVTAFFAIGLRHTTIATVFSDLLPSDHEYVDIFKTHPNFGNPLTVQVMLKRKDGDIYQAETLAKVWRLTQTVDLIPAVDHDRILSIASEKVRSAEATPSGVDSQPLMTDRPVLTADEIQAVRERVVRAPGVVGFLVSPNHSAALIQATFIERNLDYWEVFHHLTTIADKERDANHDIHIVGLPMLTGWVYFYEREMLWIFGVTLASMLLALILYTRNIAGVVTPIVVSTISAIWGFGFVGWLGHNVEPLIMVVPMLLIARSFSHCVQVTERYYEQLHRLGDKHRAAENALGMLLVPGTLGIVTDAAALFLIGVTPIPMMQKFALFCGFWALTLFPANVLMSPVILSLLPTPKNAARIVSREHATRLHKWLGRFLSRVAVLSYGPRNWITGVALLAAIAIGLYSVTRVTLGNDAEGSTLLWTGSPYNHAVRVLNAHFPGPNTLEIVFEGKQHAAMRRSEAIHTMLRLQRHLESQPNPPAATLSFADYLPEINRLFSGGNPKWLPLDHDDQRLQGPVNALLFGSNVENFGHVVDLTLQNGVVTAWVKDLRTETINRIIAQARAAVSDVGAEHDGFRIRLGSGTVALQKAVNDRVVAYEWIVTALLLTVITITCSLAYRSTAAGVILILPVITANLMLASCMAALGISLDVNTMPITAIAIGVGIDYGIYLLSRLREEAGNGENGGLVIQRSITTTGKAIFFTATVILIGLLPWYFLSNLRFQAEMGLLLAIAMIINMIVALLMIPLIVHLTRPRFIFKAG